jgi:RNA polymerase sigma-70 factor (ECF subfamily)
MEDSPKSPVETLVLIRAAQGGDAAALDALFARYLPRVRHIVALRLGWRLRQVIEVDDIVQEVLIDAFQGLERFEPRSEASFRNWLARCVEREITDASRTETRKKRGGGKVRRFGDYDSSFLGSTLFGADTDSPSAGVRADELSQRLEEAILQLPAYQRDLIVLRALCEMSYAEVARELGISREETVRVAYSRALRQLKELLRI